MTKSILSRMFFRRPPNAGRPSEKCMKQGVPSLFLLREENCAEIGCFGI